MTVADRRAEIAASIDSDLVGIKVRPYQPPTPKPREGWLEIDQTDLEGCTFGEVRLTVSLVIPLSTNRQTFEKAQDDYTVPIIAAITAAGGRAPVLTLTVVQVVQSAYYALNVTFLTESEAA